MDGDHSIENAIFKTNAFFHGHDQQIKFFSQSKKNPSGFIFYICEYKSFERNILKKIEINQNPIMFFMSTTKRKVFFTNHKKITLDFLNQTSIQREKLDFASF